MSGETTYEVGPQNRALDREPSGSGMDGGGAGAGTTGADTSGQPGGGSAGGAAHAGGSSGSGGSDASSGSGAGTGNDSGGSGTGGSGADAGGSGSDDSGNSGSGHGSGAGDGSGGLIQDIVREVGTIADGAGGLPGTGLPGPSGSIGGILDDVRVGPVIDVGALDDGNGAITGPLGSVSGGLTDGLLTDGLLGGSNGDGAILDLGVVRDGDAAGELLGETGSSATDALGLGPIVEVNAIETSNGDPAVSVSADGSRGPIVDADVFGNDDTGSTNLIDLGADPTGAVSDVAVSALGGSADSAHPQVDGNLINVGPQGQTLADADILTAANPLLDGVDGNLLGGDLIDGALGAGDALPELGDLGGIAGIVPHGDGLGALGLNLTGDAAVDTHPSLLTAVAGGDALIAL